MKRFLVCAMVLSLAVSTAAVGAPSACGMAPGMGISMPAAMTCCEPGACDCRMESQPDPLAAPSQVVSTENAAFELVKPVNGPISPAPSIEPRTKAKETAAFDSSGKLYDLYSDYRI